MVSVWRLDSCRVAQRPDGLAPPDIGRRKIGTTMRDRTVDNEIVHRERLNDCGRAGGRMQDAALIIFNR